MVRRSEKAPVKAEISERKKPSEPTKASIQDLSRKETQSSELIPKEYNRLLEDIKERVRRSQIKAVTAANKELISLYWTIGKIIIEKQENSGWGTKFIEKLAKDLQNTFPGIEGFSRRNIFRMRAFYLAYQLVPQAVALIEDLPIFEIPWGHTG